MNRLVFIIFIVFICPAFAIDVHIDIGKPIKSSILDVSGKHIKVLEHYLRVTAPISPEKTRYFDVQMIYDSKSHLFWWEYYALMKSQLKTPIGDVFSSNRKIIYTTGSKIVGFSYSSSSIWVIESSARYSSLAEGEDKVIIALKNGITDIARGVSIIGHRDIEVGRIMVATFGHNFFHDSDKPLSPEPKLIDVKKGKKDKNWHVILEGSNKIKGEVILSEDYQVLGAALLPDKAQQDKPK